MYNTYNLFHAWMPGGNRLKMRTLYHYWLSPSSRKIRIILGEKKLDHRLRVERPWAPSEELLNLNPSGRVPVLIDVNEIIISHDNAIIEYLEEAYPGRSLIGNDIYQRAEVRRLAGWFDELFYDDVTHKIVYEKVLRDNLGMVTQKHKSFERGWPICTNT